ncbi:MAG: polysaccharide deacetylase family protein [Clostridia bacterium]|nr:polysaccharide deacetylase family protein [Clostridia bacterium]
MYGLIKAKRAALILFVLGALLLSGAIYARCCAAVSARPAESREVPIIMYHSVLIDSARTGDYVVTPETIRADLLYLSRHGYETVFIRDLADFAESGADLPKKPVVITFDDGFLNNISYALPMLEEYSMKAVISPVGAYCDVYTEDPDRNLYYSYMTWDDIKSAAETGRIETGNHSYDMHSRRPRLGASRMDGENEADYARRLTEDTAKMQNKLRENCGVDCTVYTYPFGAVSPEAAETLKSLGFRAALTCREEINTVTRGDTDALYSLGRFNRPGLLSTEEFMARAGIK